MFAPSFTLTVVVSEDGFIARHVGEAPHLWASPEEQALFGIVQGSTFPELREACAASLVAMDCPGGTLA